MSIKFISEYKCELNLHHWHQPDEENPKATCNLLDQRQYTLKQDRTFSKIAYYYTYLKFQKFYSSFAFLSELFFSGDEVSLLIVEENINKNFGNRQLNVLISCQTTH